MQKCEIIEKQHPYFCHRVHNSITDRYRKFNLRIGRDRKKKNKKRDQDRPAAIAETDIHSFHMATWSTEIRKRANNMKRASDHCRKAGVGESNGIKNTWGSFKGNLGWHHTTQSRARGMEVQEGHEYEGKAHSSQTKIKDEKTISSNASGVNAPWISHTLLNGQTKPAQLDKR